MIPIIHIQVFILVSELQKLLDRENKAITAQHNHLFQIKFLVQQKHIQQKQMQNNRLIDQIDNRDFIVHLEL